MIPGISAAGFHPLIRLAYSLEAGDYDDIPATLAFFADTYNSLGQITPNNHATSDIDTLLQKISNTPAFTEKNFPTTLISKALSNVAVIPEFSEVGGMLEPDRSSLENLAKIAITEYSAASLQKNLLPLHTVTATHALRIVKPYIKDFNLAFQYHWQALAAAFIILKTPILTDHKLGEIEDRTKDFSWEPIKERAILSNDPHVIKMINTCIEEEKIYSNPLDKYGGIFETSFDQRWGE